MSSLTIEFDRTHFTQDYGYMAEIIDWITTEQAAEIMGIAEETVRRLCREEKIHSRKWHRSWQVDRAAAIAYEKSEGGRGNKYKNTETKQD